MLVCHELLGVGWLVGAWVSCYHVRATSRMIHALPRRFHQWHKQGTHWTQKMMQGRMWKGVASRVDPTRLAVSGAESFVLRKILLPITIPAKIYGAYYMSN